MQSYDLEFHDYAQLFPLIIGDDVGADGKLTHPAD